MEEITINYEKVKWTDAQGYPEGSKVKVLREGGPEEGKTFLHKIKSVLGLREFSVAPVGILEIKEISRLVTKEQTSLIANKALGMDSSKEIENLLMTQYPLRHS